MEDWEKLMPWMSQLSGDDLTGDWVSELWDGVLLCQVVNGLSPNKININMNFENDENATVENLRSFLEAAKDLGVDEAHLFKLEQLEENPDPDAETMENVRNSLSALKAIFEERGSLEKQNIWRRDAAEVRAQQNDVRNQYHNKENKTLSDITGAVRNFKRTTNQDGDLRYQKKGQQKWKLFETNYQREKGITLEESLQEIEEFERTGKAPASMSKPNKPRGTGGATQGFRGHLQSTLTKEEEAANSASGGTSAGSKTPGGKRTTNRPGGLVAMGKPELLNKPQRGGGKGREFFQNFAANQGNKPKKLW